MKSGNGAGENFFKKILSQGKVGGICRRKEKREESLKNAPFFGKKAGLEKILTGGVVDIKQESRLWTSRGFPLFPPGFPHKTRWKTLKNPHSVEKLFWGKLRNLVDIIIKTEKNRETRGIFTVKNPKK